MPSSLADIEAVRAVVQKYVDACAAADASWLRAALHPSWTMYGVDALGTDVASTVNDFVTWVAEQPPPVDYRAAITHVDVSGVVASVTVVEENYYGLDYVICFTLVRYGAEWALVTKSYSQIPPQ